MAFRSHTYLFFGLIVCADTHADLSLHWVHIVFLLSCGRPCPVCLHRNVVGSLRLGLFVVILTCFFGLIVWADTHADLCLHWVHVFFLKFVFRAVIG